MKRYLSALLVLVALICSVPGSAAASTQAKTCADILNQLGLFSGTGTDASGAPIYDLDRSPTRSEAITMLVALLGKSEEAKNGSWQTPFTDVEDWAKPYVGYAYANGLTSGTSATTYGGKELVTASQYLTFVLKALGYSSATDFQWDKAWLLSDQLGITDGAYHAGTRDFFRGDLAMISEGALAAKQKGTAQTLADKLMAAGVFTHSQYARAYGQETPAPSTGQTTALTAEEISDKCAPAVFFVELYGFNGELRGTGSGFFISPDGLAVTNYHVAANTSAMKITMPDGTVYSDVDVVDVHEVQDLALLRVRGAKNVPYLTLNDSGAIKQGQQIYTIGSPRGLDNTMSQGIISNPKRMEQEEEFIQISAPIASGSSGGALLNQYGQVIGVTTATYGEGNLNLAVPARFIREMDWSAAEGYVYYDDSQIYSGFEYVPDFGALSGVDVRSVTDTPLGYYMEYDFFDFHDLGAVSASDHFSNTIYYYYETLIHEGFTQTYVSESSNLCGVFEKNGEQVWFDVDFEAYELWVTVQYAPRYYEDHPWLPDLGWYLGLDGYGPERVDESDVYVYEWARYYTLDELANHLDWYFEWMEDEDFVYRGGENAAWLLEGNGLSVVIMIQDNLLILGVQPL